MRLDGCEEGQLGEPLGREGDIRDIVTPDEIQRRSDVEYVVAYDLTELHPEICLKDRDLGLVGDVDAGLAEQIVLAVASDHTALPI